MSSRVTRCPFGKLDQMWWTASAPGIAMCQSGAVEVTSGEASLENVTPIGLDIAKHVFQVHGVNGAGAIVCRRTLRRDDVVGFFKALPPCLIGIEACATGHHWARVLMALGHEARLMPALSTADAAVAVTNKTKEHEPKLASVHRKLAAPWAKFRPIARRTQGSNDSPTSIAVSRIRWRCELAFCSGHSTREGTICSSNFDRRNRSGSALRATVRLGRRRRCMRRRPT